jgi:hypothetical protein
LWHYADFPRNRKIAELRPASGSPYVIVSDRGLLGGDDLFVVQGAPGLRWKRWLVPSRAGADHRTLRLVFSESGGLLLSFTSPENSLIQVLAPKAAGAAPDTGDRRLPELITQKDWDEDGWTDLEEARLGLDPTNRDSDGDGLSDGADGCPDYAPSPEESTSEEVEVLQRAVFATLGLSGSRDLILVREGSPRFQGHSYGGPMLYKMRREVWQKTHGGLWISWRVQRIDTSIGEAEVQILDDAGSQSVELKRVSGRWYAVRWHRGPIE